MTQEALFETTEPPKVPCEKCGRQREVTEIEAATPDGGLAKYKIEDCTWCKPKQDPATLSTFEKRGGAIPFDSKADTRERPRLSRQCFEMVRLLCRGSATNDEFAKIARKYTQRIREIRVQGFLVDCFWQDHQTGLTKYRFTDQASWDRAREYIARMEREGLPLGRGRSVNGTRRD